MAWNYHLILNGQRFTCKTPFVMESDAENYIHNLYGSEVMVVGKDCDTSDSCPPRKKVGGFW